MPISRAKRLASLGALWNREDTWVIMINADPDAMASALALKRLMARRVRQVRIMRVNVIKRPDNLAMERYLHIPIEAWNEAVLTENVRFALVDSQPHHHVLFSNILFDCVIDHHPLIADKPVVASYIDIRPNYGATCTILHEYLRQARIKPSTVLATALLYGIRADTAALTRGVEAADFRAYRTLSSLADKALLLRVLRSEYLPEWLPEFAKAIEAMQSCGRGRVVFLDNVDNADILVVLADFFMRVHGLRWIAVSSVVETSLVVVFRSDGIVLDMGAFAAKCLGQFGTAGGHDAMARAELPLANLPADTDLKAFLLASLCE